MKNSKNSIPFFPYPQMFLHRKREYLSALESALERGAYILQRDVEEFEGNLATYLGVKHAIGVANCTDALTMALRLCGIREGDEVIISSHTFIATATAIHFAGGRPVPVEVGADHLIDPESVERAVGKKTRFLMPTQVNGRVANMDDLRDIAHRNRLTIVEDSAQGLGAKFKGRYAGTFGPIGSFSFYPAKTLGCFGDGGAMITDDSVLAEKIYAARDHGRGRDGVVALWGGNSRLDNLQAAVLNVNLSHYDDYIARRRALARLYLERLKGVGEIKLPPSPDSDPDHFDIFQNYEIQAERRDELRAYLKEYGIGTMVQWGGMAVHHHKQLGFTQNLPKTDRFFQRCVMLPMNALLEDGEVETICACIQEFYADAK